MEKLGLVILLLMLTSCTFLQRFGDSLAYGASVNSGSSYHEQQLSPYERRRAADMEVRIINIQNSLHNLEHRRP